MLELSVIVGDLAKALKAVDATAPVGGRGRFKPGVGPLTEDQAVSACVQHLQQIRDGTYSRAGPKKYPRTSRKCDLVIPDAWAIEVKLARPFGDNGKPAERWSENLLYPYQGNTSTIGDCLKLLDSAFNARKAVVVIGYEHTPPKIPLEPAVKGFELLAAQVARVALSPRCYAQVTGLIHPFHQQATVFGWEILGRLPAA